MDEALLMRRSQVMRTLGISNEEMRKLAKAKILRPLKLRKNGRAYFKRVDVLRLVKE